MKKFAIVMGIAPCLENDLEEICFGRSNEFDFMAVGVDCSDRVKFDIQHAATYHPDEFPEFKRRRELIGGNLNYKTHSHKNGLTKSKEIIEVDNIWPLVAAHPYSGSSSFLACQAAIGMGYEKIVLCGCPMSGPNATSKKINNYDVFQKGWIMFAPELFGDKVKSMSGWTKEFLGYPKKEWLEND